jgi:predicted DNA-binding protein
MSTPKSRYVGGADVDLDSEVVLDEHGRRITEERARELAEEALRTVRAGRPSLTAPGERSPEVKARVPADLRQRLTDEAERRGTTTSELVRRALEEYLAS